MRCPLELSKILHSIICKRLDDFVYSSHQDAYIQPAKHIRNFLRGIVTVKEYTNNILQSIALLIRSEQEDG